MLRFRSKIDAPLLIVPVMIIGFATMAAVGVHHDRGMVVVSPRDQHGFVSAIQSRVPMVTWDATVTAAAGARAAVWGLLIMPIALMAVLAYVFYTKH